MQSFLGVRTVGGDRIRARIEQGGRETYETYYIQEDKRKLTMMTLLRGYRHTGTTKWRLWSFMPLSTDVKKFLTEEKGYPANVAEGMLRAMPNASMHSFKQLGDSGLRALSGAVARDIMHQEQRRELPSVTVVIIPFGRREEEGLTFEANEGMTLFDLWEENRSSLGSFVECACGGIAACSTCHVILEQDAYDAITASEGGIKEAEIDMLDLAEDPQPTSRLGCQMSFRKLQHDDGDMGKLVLRLPESTNNLW